MSIDVKRCIDKSPAQAAGIIRREVKSIVCAVEAPKSCFHMAADMAPQQPSDRACEALCLQCWLLSSSCTQAGSRAVSETAARHPAAPPWGRATGRIGLRQLVQVKNGADFFKRRAALDIHALDHGNINAHAQMVEHSGQRCLAIALNADIGVKPLKQPLRIHAVAGPAKNYGGL